MKNNAIQEIIDNLSNIKGYNPKWISLITSQPLIFESVDYYNVLEFIDNKVTDEELEAYKSNKLRFLYPSFETMLMLNINYFNRIINFCTMYFLSYYVMNDSIYNDVPNHEVERLTPTKIWCASMVNQNSTKWEQEYGWNLKLDDDNFENNFPMFKANKLFSFFISERAFVNNTYGFRETFLNDKIDNDTYYKICEKFTEQSSTISVEQLKVFDDYVKHIDDNNIKLWESLHKCLMNMYDNDDMFSINLFTDEFYIHTTHFSMKVYKNFTSVKKGISTLSKDYLSNSYECFVAEPYFKPSIKKQIEWYKYKIPYIYNNIQGVLENVLLKLLLQDFRRVRCVKFSRGIDCINDKDTQHDMSILTFAGIYNKVVIKTTLYHGKTKVHEYVKNLSKENAAKYIINQGYYIIGMDNDIDNIIKIFQESKIDFTEKCYIIKSFLSKYTTNIQDFMKPVIKSYKIYNDDIIKVLLNGTVDESMLNYDISYLPLKSETSVLKITKMVNAQIADKDTIKKNYYQVLKQY